MGARLTSARAPALLACALAGAIACGDAPPPPAPKPAPKPAAPPPEDADKAQTPASIYVYSPVGKRDPFQNILQVKDVTPVKAPGGKPTPLQRWPLEKLKLVLTVSGTASPMAMVEDPEGRGWTVHVGSFIGQNWGKVTSIQRDLISVTETITDNSTGRVYPQTMTIKIPESESDIRADQQLRDGETLGAAQQSQGN